MAHLGWFKMFPGDFDRDTKHLSQGEVGAYLKLLHHYYATGEALENDERKLNAIGKAYSEGEKQNVDTVLKEFFELNGDGRWHQKRADEELSALTEYVRQQSEKGKLGGAGKHRRNNGDQAVAKQELSRSLATDKLRSSQAESESDTEEPKPLALPSVELVPQRDASAFPDCPHEAIVGFYNGTWGADRGEVLNWGKTDREHMKARWRWLCKTINPETGKPYVVDVEQGKRFFERFFAWTRNSAYLREASWFSLRWLVKSESNFDKVMGGQYHDGKR